MSAGLQDLLETMREHPSFQELLAAVEVPGIKAYRVMETDKAQTEEWIYRSGRQMQHQIWRDFLMTFDASQQEKPSERRTAGRG